MFLQLLLEKSALFERKLPVTPGGPQICIHIKGAIYINISWNLISSRYLQNILVFDHLLKLPLKASFPKKYFCT